MLYAPRELVYKALALAGLIGVVGLAAIYVTASIIAGNTQFTFRTVFAAITACVAGYLAYLEYDDWLLEDLLG